MIAVGCLAPLVLLVLGGWLGGTHWGYAGAGIGAAFGVMILVALTWALDRARES